MARQRSPADDTLHEIEESFDRLAVWVSKNRIPLLVGVVAILSIALGRDVYRGWDERRNDAAAEAVAEVREGFLAAMGAAPGDVSFQEPANPEIARAARTEFVARFEEAGREHSGTAAASLAMLQAGNLHVDLGKPERAMEVWQEGLDSTGSGTSLAALLLERMARAHEEAEAWQLAAEAFEEAGRIDGYPARFAALGDAARCWLKADEPDRALTIFAEIEDLKATDRLPEYISARLRELRKRRAIQ